MGPTRLFANEMAPHRINVNAVAIRLPCVRMPTAVRRFWVGFKSASGARLRICRGL